MPLFHLIYNSGNFKSIWEYMAVKQSTQCFHRLAVSDTLEDGVKKRESKVQFFFRMTITPFFRLQREKLL